MPEDHHRIPRPGPVYDDAMKTLADDDLAALLTLVGVHDPAQALTPELPASTRRADLLARTRHGIVHVEYVKDPTPDLALRMIDYRLRLRLSRRDRRIPITQYILALGEYHPPESYHDIDSGTSCAWTSSTPRPSCTTPPPLPSPPSPAATIASAPRR